MAGENFDMLICHRSTEPKTPSALLKQGSLSVIWAGKSAGDHHSSFIPGIPGIPGVAAPKFGKTEYKLGNPDGNLGGDMDERRR
jgi:hypothetical protein